jgi:hypothetical protein
MKTTPGARHIAPLIAGIGALCACSPEPPTARYTVDEYLANPQVMSETLEKCANDPGELRNDPDCINVQAAAERKDIGSLRDRRPLGLVPEEKAGEDESGKAKPD